MVHRWSRRIRNKSTRYGKDYDTSVRDTTSSDESKYDDARGSDSVAGQSSERPEERKCSNKKKIKLKDTAIQCELNETRLYPKTYFEAQSGESTKNYLYLPLDYVERNQSLNYKLVQEPVAGSSRDDKPMWRMVKVPIAENKKFFWNDSKVSITDVESPDGFVTIVECENESDSCPE